MSGRGGRPVLPGYVLAGGRSQRMGRDKARLEVEGVAMASRVAAALVEAGLSPVHLVSKDPAHADLGLPLLLDEPLLDEPVHDASLQASAPLQHPLVGVVRALRHARSLGAELALVAPCDLPWLDGATVALLLAVGGPVLAEAEGRRQPLLAVLPVDLHDALARAAAQGGSVHRALAALPTVEVPAASLQNVNRPGDLDLR